MRGMWEMLLSSTEEKEAIGEGPRPSTPSDWGKREERNEVDWYEDDPGSVSSRRTRRIYLATDMHSNSSRV